MMKSMTFHPGGIHPASHKETAAIPMTTLPPPDLACIPLIQHIGSPAQAVVQVGDMVKVGTVIAKGQGMISAPVHSSVSGKVVKIDTVPDAGGFRKPAIFIQREGDDWEPAIIRNFDLVRDIANTPAEIVDAIHDGGLVGKGGATFPTRVKYLVPPDRWVDTLIVNGVECEPWLTSDHRLMLERPEEVILGANLLRHVLGVKLAIIGIEDNKPDAIRLIGEKIRELGLAPPEDYLRRHLAGQGTTARDNPDRSGWVCVIPLKVKYPQGAEKQLIKALLKREVPSGKLPLDVGVIVNNVATVHSAYKIVNKKKPMFERIVTIAGQGVGQPGNYKIRLGTTIREALAGAGWEACEECKVILGGPMMGKTVSTLDVPVGKGTSGILVLAAAGIHRWPERNCIRCSRCIQVCPMGLEPWLMEKQVRLNRLDEAEQTGIRDCVECGSCSYICPAGRPLLDQVRLGKALLVKARQKK